MSDTGYDNTANDPQALAAAETVALEPCDRDRPWTGLEVPALSPDEEFTQRLVRGVDRWPDAWTAPPVFNPDHGGFYHYPWQERPAEHDHVHDHDTAASAVDSEGDGA